MIGAEHELISTIDCPPPASFKTCVVYQRATEMQARSLASQAPWYNRLQAEKKDHYPSYAKGNYLFLKWAQNLTF